MKDNLLVPTNIGCACAGDILTFKCSASGSGNTLWSGTVFEDQCSITLRHSQFESPGGVYDECSDGHIVGRSLAVEGNCYTSQLNVTVSDSFNNKTVTCTHNSGTGMSIIGVSTLTIVQGRL